ncbi:MAG: type IV secretory system conjugative DNA transfer family protein [Lachnospiraceae bacterium]|nr:type IV secretory system conjugative DNA transfer family protein [Lachnospiraceae bacterium]
MGIREQLKDLDVDISNKCRQIDELKLECSRSERGASVLSNTLSVSRDYIQTRRNNNILVFDEKKNNYDMVLENLKDDASNYIIVDFDGVCFKDTAEDFVARGYTVKSINLMNPEVSDGYNPFAYIRNEEDVNVVAKCIIDNTNSNDSLKVMGEEPVAVKDLERKFFKILISCYMKYGTSKTLTAVVNLLANEDREEKLDKLFSGQFPQGPNEEECRRFQDFKQEAGERYLDIVQSCYERIQFFKDERLIALTKAESLNFQHLYLGKEVLYIVVSSALNYAQLFISMILSQICYTLCDESRKNNKDRMVMIYFDILADVGSVVNLEYLLPQFCQYNVGSMLLVNNFSQIGQVYDKWKELLDSCDVIVYFGAYDELTQGYVLENADSVMIRKTKVMGKEMYKTAALKPEELKRVELNECIVVVKGVATFLSIRCGAVFLK